MESLKELSEFLNLGTRLDLKVMALQHVLSVTATREGREFLLSIPEILRQLVLLMQDDSLPIAKDAVLGLVNITADEAGANALLLISETSKLSADQKPNDNLIFVCLRNIMDKESTLADPCCMVLSNMTRPTNLVDRIVSIIENSGFTWDAIVSAFTANKYNNKGAGLHYLGPVFSNLSQSAEVRRFLTDRNRTIIQRLLPFTEYTDSIVRRGGIVGTLKNCCFDVENHEWLLSEKVDILPQLLLPLAGPEEFDDEDNDKLPVELQYLPEDKQREPDPDIRTILLEALGQLCVTKRGREILRNKNAYAILREFHKWEKDRAVLLACENVVDILIRTEKEIGVDNLKDVNVPLDYAKKFHEMDRDFIDDA